MTYVTSIKPPLVVDLDGTLTPIDTLVESVISLLKESPSKVFSLFLFLLRGRTAFKGFVASNTNFSAERLPLNEPLLAYLRSEKTSGRRIILATASHKLVAEKVANYLELFDDIIATEGAENMKGTNKLNAIRLSVGDNFVYAGDSSADIPIWNSAKAAILVNVSSSTSKSVQESTVIEANFPRKKELLLNWAKALRIHQWLKNILIFVPLLTAFSFADSERLIASIVAFFSFSFVASATYLVNDLWDLDHDRSHERKCHRPLASSAISITDAILASGLFLFVGLGLAYFVSGYFFLTILLYLLVTSTYSWVLKQYVLVDVIVLSFLYTLRIIAGSVAIEVLISTWLLAFSVFIFLSLALVKRCSELVSLKNSGLESASGRDYCTNDLTILSPLGVGSALSAVVVFGLFISAPETVDRYASPYILWFVALGLIYWLSRLWLKTARGEMHDDPIVYALKDKGSQATFLAIFISILIAYYFDFEQLFGG